jgi:hypothetical protein
MGGIYCQYTQVFGEEADFRTVHGQLFLKKAEEAAEALGAR